MGIVAFLGSIDTLHSMTRRDAQTKTPRLALPSSLSFRFQMTPAVGSSRTPFEKLPNGVRNYAHEGSESNRCAPDCEMETVYFSSF